MKHSPGLVLGTFNEKKRAELVQLIQGQNIQLSALSDFPKIDEVEETGNTFEENAELKAVQYAEQLGEWVLAEDSGLSVRALDGAPGVYSSRFGGENASDATNNRLLLEKLANEPLENRAAWYTCNIVLADPQGNVRARSEAQCHGRIVNTPRGNAGFGYDPLFEIPEYKLTFAELGESVKAILSHRARAYRKLLPRLLAVMQVVTVSEGIA